MAKVIVVNGAISMSAPAPGIFSFDRCASAPRNALNFHGIAIVRTGGKFNRLRQPGAYRRAIVRRGLPKRSC
jgi:hypothetical protein